MISSDKQRVCMYVLIESVAGLFFSSCPSACSSVHRSFEVQHFVLEHASTTRPPSAQGATQNACRESLVFHRTSFDWLEDLSPHTYQAQHSSGPPLFALLRSRTQAQLLIVVSLALLSLSSACLSGFVGACSRKIHFSRPTSRTCDNIE